MRPSTSRRTKTRERIDHPSRGTWQTACAASWLALCLGFFTPAIGNAALPSRTTVSAADELDKGELRNVSLSADGALSLAPHVRYLDLPRRNETGTPLKEALIWSLVATKDGRLYAGTGNSGSILVGAKDRPFRLLCRTGELMVTSFVELSDGAVLAGTCPNGRIYRIVGDKANLFAQVPAPYVWALQTGQNGDVLAASGPEGTLFKIDANRKVTVAAKTTERNLTSMALAPDGSLFVGTEPSGLVMKLDRLGKMTVLFDAPQAEIRALAFDRKGNLYAAATTPTKTTPPSPPTVDRLVLGPMPAAITASGKGPGMDAPTGPTASPDPTPSPVPSAASSPLSDRVGPRPLDGPTSAPTSAPEGASTTPQGNEGGAPDVRRSTRAAAPSKFGRKGVDPNQAVYRLSPTGCVTQVFSAGQAVLLCLAVGAEDRVLIGTGNEGLVFELDGETVSKQVKFDATQILSLIPLPDGGFAAGTSGPARIGLLGPSISTQGTWQSEAKDFGSVSSWGAIGATIENARVGTVRLLTRSGNSGKPDDTWNPWEPVLSRPMGYAIVSPGARYLQLQVELSSADRQSSPIVREVWMMSRQINLPPEIDKLEVGLPTVDPVSDPRDVELRESQKDKRKKKRESPSLRHVKWDVSDPNDDRLLFTLSLKGEGETSFRELNSRELTASSLDWDTCDLPDGWYRLRLVASDRGSNPDETALRKERISEVFLVDNTPPKLESIVVKNLEGGEVSVSGVAVDGPAMVVNVEFALDDKEFQQASFNDGLGDSPREEFKFSIRRLGSGVHSIAIRAYDELGNGVTESRTVQVP